MSQAPTSTAALEVTPEFLQLVPASPAASRQLTQLGTMSATDDTRQQLSCLNLLVGDTRTRAEEEAASMLPKMLGSAQTLAAYGNEALHDLNALVDEMLDKRPDVNIPEIREAMKVLDRTMRDFSSKYDPSDPKVRERYDDVKKKFLGFIELGRNFFDDFRNDMRSFREQMDVAEDRLGGKQFQLLESIAFYDQFDAMNEQRIDALIYVIGVMEKVRDLAIIQADSIVVGDASLGDRQGEQQSKVLDFVMLIKSRITAFKGRLWAAWAMAPLNRNMRNTALHQAARIDQTIGVSIPAIKESVLFWFSLGELEQASALTEAMDDLLNFALTGLANASKVAIPEIHERLATPALRVATVITMTQSVVAQTEGIIKALETRQQKERELDAAMLSSKQVMDGSTLKLNEARLAYLLQEANDLKTIEISRSVPPAAELPAGNQN